MSLNQSQRDSARHNGGKVIANRKSTLARVASSLSNLIEDHAGTEGVISPQDLDVLRQSRAIVARVESALGKDLAEARRIKADWDKRHTAALKTAASLVGEDIADVVALADVAGHIHNAQVILREAMKLGLQATLYSLRRDAIASMAYRAAKQSLDGKNHTTDPETNVRVMATEMPAAKLRQTDLIRSLTALPVQNTLTTAAQAA